MTRTHYDVLGVTREAPEEVIRASYTALMRRAHPDTGNSDPEQVRLLTEARHVLMDRARRAEYDRSLAEAAATAELEPSAPRDASWGAETAWDEPADTTSPFDSPWREDIADRDDPMPDVPPPYPQHLEDPPPIAPPPYPPPGGHPGYGVAVGQPGRQFGLRDLLRSRTVLERIFTWSWAVLSLLGPALIVASALFSSVDRGGVVGNLIAFALPLAISVHVGLVRLNRPRLPKRYVVWVLLGILLMWANREIPLLALVVAAWVTAFVAGIELKRRRLWGNS